MRLRRYVGSQATGLAAVFIWFFVAIWFRLSLSSIIVASLLMAVVIAILILFRVRYLQNHGRLSKPNQYQNL
jgi:hypothetical protein